MLVHTLCGKAGKNGALFLYGNIVVYIYQSF